MPLPTGAPTTSSGSIGRDGILSSHSASRLEAEWEYAARAGVSENKYPWEGDLPPTEDKGCFYANFAPGGQLCAGRPSHQLRA